MIDLATAENTENTAEETVFGDLNGPLLFWGPAAASLPQATFTPEEEALLRRLRDKLASAGSYDAADACTALLPEPITAASR